MRSSSVASWWRNSLPASHKWIGKLLLKSPASLRSLRDVPILGHLIHRLSHRILPTDETVWARIEAGPATGLRFELNPRTGQATFAAKRRREFRRF